MDDSKDGYYYEKVGEKSTCISCMSWNYPLKSCYAQNAEVAQDDCHRIGENQLDAKCYEKRIIKGMLSD